MLGYTCFKFTSILADCEMEKQFHMLSEYYVFVKYICIFLKCSLNHTENVSNKN